MERLKGLPNIKTDMELNDRIYDRNKVTGNIQMYYGITPEQTRFQLFPNINKNKNSKVPLEYTEMFDMKTNFLPGNGGGPYEGIMNNIDVESELKNIIHPFDLTNQNGYIPMENSELYNSRVPKKNNNLMEKHELLFNELKISGHDMNPYNIGKKNFFNHTRQQIKDISVNK